MQIERKQIVVLGGGFGGVYTARHLERLLSQRDHADVVLISRYNYFLMTPLLFEAGSGVLEPRHAVSPLRKIFRHVRFVQAEVESIDFEKKTVRARAPESQEAYELNYAHLVIAVGGVTNTEIIPGSDTVLTFKVLSDAIRLRNHCIELFERADVEPDQQWKRRLLTFVIAGGGLVGMELVGELTDFLKNLTRSYSHIHESDIRIELLEGGPHIMREMDRDLADYAQRVLTRRGVHFRVDTKVKAFEKKSGYHIVHLPDAGSIEASTVIAATGVKSNPVLDGWPLQKDKKGRLETAPTMLCKGRTDVWALGDCANIPDPDGKPYPQLAQHALREARVLAGNIVATLHNQPLQPFVFETVGTLAALGHYKGVGKIKEFKIRGFIAWWVWRSYYLLQMPRWNRRLRIVVDWTMAMLFKNDIVELNMWDQDRPADPAHERVESLPAESTPK
jgi:NADH dehydrogenase